MHHSFGVLPLVVTALQFLSALASQCPSGWKTYYGTDLCLRGFRTEKSWLDAYEDCQTYGGDGALISIHSAIQNTAVATMAEETFAACFYWIGLSTIQDDSNYTWADGTPVDYINWAPGQPPANAAGTTVYLSLTSNFRWIATEEIAETSCYICTQSLYVAPKQCSTETGWQVQIGNSHKCIKGFRNEMSWLDAWEYCQGQGYKGDLVSIHNTFENAQVTTIAQQTFEACEYWIGLNGLTDPTFWTWTDASTYDYRYWDDGMPPPTPDGFAAKLVLDDRSKWKATTDIAENHCFVCETQLA